MFYNSVLIVRGICIKIFWDKVPHYEYMLFEIIHDKLDRHVLGQNNRPCATLGN